MTWLLKIIHRPCCEWFMLSNWVRIADESPEGECHLVALYWREGRDLYSRRLPKSATHAKLSRRINSTTDRHCIFENNTWQYSHKDQHQGMTKWWQTHNMNLYKQLSLSVHSRRSCPTPRNLRFSSFTSMTLNTVKWNWWNAASRCTTNWKWWTSFIFPERWAVC